MKHPIQPVPAGRRRLRRHRDDASPLHPVSRTRELLGGISRSTLYQLFRDGALRTVKIGTRTFVPQSEIDALIERKLGEGKQ